jgi:hypothetical protein
VLTFWYQFSGFVQTIVELARPGSPRTSPPNRFDRLHRNCLSFHKVPTFDHRRPVFPFRVYLHHFDRNDFVDFAGKRDALFQKYLQTASSIYCFVGCPGLSRESKLQCPEFQLMTPIVFIVAPITACIVAVFIEQPSTDLATKIGLIMLTLVS